MFVGSFQGNVVGNVVVPGQNTQVLYNDNGNAGASSGFTFDSQQQLVTISGDLVANTVTLGSGENELYTQSAFFATTASAASEQILHSISQDAICAIEYTIIATDTISTYRQTTRLFAGVSGPQVNFYEFGTLDIPTFSTGVGDFAISNDGAGLVRLTVTPASANACDSSGVASICKLIHSYCGLALIKDKMSPNGMPLC